MKCTCNYYPIPCNINNKNNNTIIIIIIIIIIVEINYNLV